MKIMLAGQRGAGKTTCCIRAIKLLEGVELCGFITHKGEDSLIIEDIKTREREVLAYYEERAGKYLFFKEGIDFGIEALEREGKICFADEIGRLELNKGGFYRAFPILREKKNVVMTCRDIFADELRKVFDGCIMERIDESSRDDMPQKIRKYYVT